MARFSDASGALFWNAGGSAQFPVMTTTMLTTTAAAGMVQTVTAAPMVVTAAPMVVTMTPAPMAMTTAAPMVSTTMAQTMTTTMDAFAAQAAAGAAAQAQASMARQAGRMAEAQQAGMEIMSEPDPTTTTTTSPCPEPCTATFENAMHGFIRTATSSAAAAVQGAVHEAFKTHAGAAMDSAVAHWEASGSDTPPFCDELTTPPPPVLLQATNAEADPLAINSTTTPFPHRMFAFHGAPNAYCIMRVTGAPATTTHPVDLGGQEMGPVEPVDAADLQFLRKTKNATAGKPVQVMLKPQSAAEAANKSNTTLKSFDSSNNILKALPPSSISSFHSNATLEQPKKDSSNDILKALNGSISTFHATANNIVKALNGSSVHSSGTLDDGDAAAEIKRLRAENAELKRKAKAEENKASSGENVSPPAASEQVKEENGPAETPNKSNTTLKSFDSPNNILKAVNGSISSFHATANNILKALNASVSSLHANANQVTLDDSDDTTEIERLRAEVAELKRKAQTDKKKKKKKKQQAANKSNTTLKSVNSSNNILKAVNGSISSFHANATLEQPTKEERGPIDWKTWKPENKDTLSKKELRKLNPFAVHRLQEEKVTPQVVKSASLNCAMPAQSMAHKLIGMGVPNEKVVQFVTANLGAECGEAGEKATVANQAVEREKAKTSNVPVKAGMKILGTFAAGSEPVLKLEVPEKQTSQQKPAAPAGMKVMQSFTAGSGNAMATPSQQKPAAPAGMKVMQTFTAGSGNAMATPSQQKPATPAGMKVMGTFTAGSGNAMETPSQQKPALPAGMKIMQTFTATSGNAMETPSQQKPAAPAAQPPAKPVEALPKPGAVAMGDAAEAALKKLNLQAPTSAPTVSTDDGSKTYPITGMPPGIEF
jgi:hypothetical protein